MSVNFVTGVSFKRNTYATFSVHQYEIYTCITNLKQTFVKLDKTVQI